jgi:hypothetical protein
MKETSKQEGESPWTVVARIPIVRPGDDAPGYLAEFRCMVTASNDPRIPANLQYRTYIQKGIGEWEDGVPMMIEDLFSVPFHADAAIVRELIAVYDLAQEMLMKSLSRRVDELPATSSRVALFPDGASIPMDEGFPHWFAYAFLPALSRELKNLDERIMTLTVPT